MRQVQARAVRQECAEGVEEVERGGRKEGWELIAAREQEGTDKSFLLCLLTIYLVGEVGGVGHGGTFLGGVSLVIPKTFEG